MFELIKAVYTSTGQESYEPYSMEGVSVFVGVPPEVLTGVDTIRAFRNSPKAKLFKCFTQNGAFVSNRNITGIIEIVVATESPAHAVIQVFDLSGIGFPVYATDQGTAGSSFISSTKSRVILTPPWRKSKNQALTVYTIECTKLAISGGVRKVLSR